MSCIILNYSREYVLYDTDIFTMYTFVDDVSHKTIKNRDVTPHALKKSSSQDISNKIFKIY